MQDQPVPNTAEAKFAAWQQGVEERLRALETAPRITNTSQRGGSYILLDDEGRHVVFFGEYTRGVGGAGYGFQVKVPDGAGPDTSPTVIEVDDDGLEAPFLDIPVQKANDFVVVTSGSFATIWQATAALTVARAITVGASVGCDASTTGEVRLVVGSITSGVVSCAAGVFTDPHWDLLLEDDTIGSGPLIVLYQARRVSGAGNVNVYPPYISQAGDNGTGATATGL